MDKSGRRVMAGLHGCSWLFYLGLKIGYLHQTLWLPFSAQAASNGDEEALMTGGFIGAGAKPEASIKAVI